MILYSLTDYSYAYTPCPFHQLRLSFLMTIVLCWSHARSGLKCLHCILHCFCPELSPGKDINPRVLQQGTKYKYQACGHPHINGLQTYKQHSCYKGNCYIGKLTLYLFYSKVQTAYNIDNTPQIWTMMSICQRCSTM